MLEKLLKIIAITCLFSTSSVMASKKEDANRAIYEANVLIQAAERSDAQSYAVYELKSARENINKAQVKLEDNKWSEAEIYAKKAQRDAEVADAKSQATKAENSLTDLQIVVDTLRNELYRFGETK
jgi:hypothetical protein